MNCNLFCKRCLVNHWSSKVLSEGSRFNFLSSISLICERSVTERTASALWNLRFERLYFFACQMESDRSIYFMPPTEGEFKNKVTGKYLNVLLIHSVIY